MLEDSVDQFVESGKVEHDHWNQFTMISYEIRSTS